MIVKKLRRAIEAAHLLTAHAADASSWRALIAAYAATTAEPFSSDLIDVRLRVETRRFPLRMRQSDIYTLAEVFHERQYRIVEELPERPTIVDAGANIGITGIWFLAHRPGARLHCFEPEGTNHRLLCENLAGRGEVTIARAALGAHDGETTLHVARHGALHSTRPPSGASGAGSEAGRGEAEVSRDGSEVLGTETVPVVRLGEYLETAEVSTVDLLKLDVEGAELDLLQGLGAAIDRVDRIAGEIHESRVDTGAVYGLIDAAGYRVLETRRFASSGGEDVHFFTAARDPGKVSA